MNTNTHAVKPSEDLHGAGCELPLNIIDLIGNQLRKEENISSVLHTELQHPITVASL